MTNVKLDRIDICDIATHPVRIANEIHRQLGNWQGAIPIDEIARALDIERIEYRNLKNVEAMLLTCPERDIGHVMLNAKSSLQRRRYSLAHELGHFLCFWHRSTETVGFICSKRDMANPTGQDIHVRQEKEANLFAIELLAPVRQLSPYLRRLPDLEHVLALHNLLDISKAAAARRYANLHSRKVAVLFAQHGKFSYVERSGNFPYLPFERGEPLPALPAASRFDAPSEMTDASGDDWRLSNVEAELSVQVIPQEDGHAIVLLYLESDAD